MMDKRGMYLEGCAFLDCANICKEKAESDDSIGGFELMTLAIVNCAFACEIFLKLLLMIYNVEMKRKHKLKELFDLLPKDIRNRINEELYYNRGGSLKNAVGIPYIELISDAFTEWRYKYEYHRLQNETGFMFSFCEILQNECINQLNVNSDIL